MFGRQKPQEEREAEERERLARVHSVACPYCKAAPGKPCTQVGGKGHGRKRKLVDYCSNRAQALIKAGR